MQVIISAAVSADGYMDDSSPERLILSNREDWLEVYRLRAGCDAILVGAETLRRDNPALIIRDEALRAERSAAGMPVDIAKITVTANGNLDTSLRFFTEGPDIPKIVFIRRDAPPHNCDRLARVAEVVSLNRITAGAIVGSLAAKGFERLMVEGGARIIKMFLDEDMADEFRLAVAPLTVEDEHAPRLPYFGHLPFEKRASKTERRLGNMTVTEYVIHHEQEK